MAKVTITIEDTEVGGGNMTINAKFQFTPDLNQEIPYTMAQSAGMLLNRTLSDALRPLDRLEPR